MNNKEYLGEELIGVYNHIMSGFDKSRYEYTGFKKGMIVTGDETGKLLTFVKENLKYDNLKLEGKITELNIDASWTDAMTKSQTNVDAREAWNRMVAAAYQANHGLLVLNITNIKLFELCWHIKQLAKQEKPLEIWPLPGTPFEYNEDEDVPALYNELKDIVVDLNAAKLIDLINGFNFDGYVLLNICGFSWEKARKYALEHCEDEFQAMWNFYTGIWISDIEE